MTTRHWFLGLAWLAVACSGPRDSTPAKTVERRCGNDRTLTGQGIGDLRVGATVNEVRALCDVLRDTILASAVEGGPEHRLLVRLDEDTVAATVDGGRVWRIEVRSPRFRTADSLGVGSSVAELTRQPVEYIGYGEGGPFVSVSRHCGLSLRLTGVRGFARTLSEVPPEARVDLILVLGCATESKSPPE